MDVNAYRIGMGETLAPVAILPGPETQNSLHLCWMLHNFCNQRCTYCDESNWGGSDRWLTYDHVIRFFEQMFAHYHGKRMHISFTGGEPTLWKDFSRLCRYLSEKGCDIGMTTNGSRSLKFWGEMDDCFNWLNFSYHPEFAKDDHLLEVISLMAKRTRIAVRLMMHQDRQYWEKSVAFADKLRALPDDIRFFVEYVPLQTNLGPGSKPVVYEDWQKEFFAANNHFSRASSSEEITRRVESRRKVWEFDVVYADGTRKQCQPNELVAKDQANFKDWTCHAGLDILFISHLGDIFRAGCQVNGSFGHIFDEQIHFPVEPIRCPLSFCACGSDIQAQKTAPGFVDV